MSAAVSQSRPDRTAAPPWRQFDIAMLDVTSGDLVRGRGKVPEDAIEAAIVTTRSFAEDHGYPASHAVWEGDELLAIVRPPSSPGAPLFVVRFDVARPDPAALDAAAAEYLRSDARRRGATRHVLVSLALDAIGASDPRGLDDPAPWCAFGVETEGHLVWLAPCEDADGVHFGRVDLVVIPRAAVVKLVAG